MMQDPQQCVAGFDACFAAGFGPRWEAGYKHIGEYSPSHLPRMPGIQETEQLWQHLEEHQTDVHLTTELSEQF